MRKFFMRNAPETIRDAQTLSKEDFTEKYKETTATIEIISKAYSEIRLKHPVKSVPPPEPPKAKSVTFKVQPIHNKKPVREPVIIDDIPDDTCEEEDEIEPSHEQIIEDDMLISKRESDFSIAACAARGRDISDTNEDEMKVIKNGEFVSWDEAKQKLDVAFAIDPAITNNDVITQALYEDGKIKSVSIVSSKRGRKPLPEKEKRDARIKELLLAGKKGKDIVEIMKEEGYSVHAPQVTQIKATLDKED